MPTDATTGQRKGGDGKGGEPKGDGKGGEPKGDGKGGEPKSDGKGDLKGGQPKGDGKPHEEVLHESGKHWDAIGIAVFAVMIVSAAITLWFGTFDDPPIGSVACVIFYTCFLLLVVLCFLGGHLQKRTIKVHPHKPRIIPIDAA